jgi:TolA-binding protein
MHRSLGILLVIAQVSVAHADDVARQQKRAAAEALEKEAKTTKNPAKSVECGQAYLDLYNLDQTVPDADELIYNAAVCFEEGASVGVAITLHKQITKTWPRSKLVPRAQGRLGKLYERAGQLAQAADALEVYATRYAAEKDAPDALGEAVWLRKALGDDAKQLRKPPTRRSA